MFIIARKHITPRRMLYRTRIVVESCSYRNCNRPIRVKTRVKVSVRSGEDVRDGVFSGVGEYPGTGSKYSFVRSAEVFVYRLLNSFGLTAMAVRPIISARRSSAVSK